MCYYSRYRSTYARKHRQLNEPVPTRLRAPSSLDSLMPDMYIRIEWQLAIRVLYATLRQFRVNMLFFRGARLMNRVSIADRFGPLSSIAVIRD